MNIGFLQSAMDSGGKDKENWIAGYPEEISRFNIISTAVICVGNAGTNIKMYLLDAICNCVANGYTNFNSSD